ncbi:MAG: CARDB domain-containing protein [Candidatus Micrarchaeia archaeon]
MNKTAFLALFLVFLSGSASAALSNAWIINESGAVQNMSYRVVAHSYLDGGDGNKNIKLMVENTTPLASYNGTFVYRINGPTNYTLPAGASTNSKVDPFTCGTSTCNTSLNLRFDSSWAVYPGRVWALATDDTPTDNDILTAANTTLHPNYQFVLINFSNGWLIGSYVINNTYVNGWNGVYDQNSGNATIKVTTIKNLIYPDTPDIPNPNQNRNVTKGICDDEYGFNCNSSTVDLPNASNSLFTGVTGAQQMALNQPIQKQIVINGLNYSLCIGPDLIASSLGASFPSSGRIYSVNASAAAVSKAITELGQPLVGTENFTVSWQLRNVGNVNTSKPFNVTFYKSSVDPNNKIYELTVNENLTPGQYKSGSFSALAYNTRNYYFMVVDSASEIGECSESNNGAQTSADAKLAYSIYFYNESGSPITSLEYTGRPISLLVYANDSLGNPVAGNLTRIVQENGIELFAPVQQGMRPYAIAEVTTNASGWANMTLIPTGNQYYDKWNFGSYTNLYNYLQSNYSLYAELYVDGVRKARVELPLTSLTPTDPTGANIHSLNPPFKTLIEFVYDAALGVMKTVRNWLQITNVP